MEDKYKLPTTKSTERRLKLDLMYVKISTSFLIPPFQPRVWLPLLKRHARLRFDNRRR